MLLLAAIDGVGGYEGGEVAADITARTLQSYVEAHSSDDMPLDQDYEKKMAAYREHQARKMAEAQAIQRDMDAVQDSISSLTGSRKARVDTVRTLALTLSKGL